MEKPHKRDMIHRWKYVFSLFKFMGIYAKKEMSFMMFLTIFMGLIPLLSLFAFQQLINTFVNLGENIINVFMWVFIFIGTLILQSIGNTFGSMLRDHVQEKIKVNLQEVVIEKTQKISYSQFEDPNLYDQLKRANNGIDSKFFSSFNLIFASITNTITLGSLLVYLLFIHWSIPLILLIGCAIFTIIQVKFINETYVVEVGQTSRMRKLSYLEQLMTTRRPAKEIRLFGLDNYLLEKWNRLNKELREERLALVKKESRVDMNSSSGNTFIFAIVLTITVYVATMGLLSIGQYAAFLRAVIQFQGVLFMLFLETALFNNDLRYIQDFFDFLELPEKENRGEHIPEKSLKKGIYFEGVSYSYPNSTHPVFENVDLHIKPGERIALVGNNGSGKTTFIKLLLGLYIPSEGKIYIEGKDIRTIDLSSWWKKCTAIFQDFHKYHLTIKENIAIGQIDLIDEQKIEQAAKLSGADEVVANFGEGYDTFLGKEFNGQELSQGQWQKIAIARAYVREAEILILDEPTAALDPLAEVEIYEQFRKVAEDKTTIFISHRLGICHLADRIIVLNDGRIEEQGTHDQLLQANGHYAKMYRLQSEWYQ